MISLSELGNTLRSYKNVLLATHIAPDPDALGSCFGLALGLKAAGVSVTAYCADGLLERMSGLFSGIPVAQTLPDRTFDALVVVDTAAKSRVAGASAELYSRADVVVNIDHHISNPGWGDVNYIDTTSPASALIVFELLQAMQLEVDSQMASLLFAGLIDDTGCFRFSNTSARALRVAAQMVDAGAVPQLVANSLYFNVPLRVLKLRSEAMSGLRLVCQGAIALVTAPKSLLEACGAAVEDTEGIVDEARLVEGTVGAVFIRELSDGWKCSLRAKDERLDVNSVAGKFGGGGHKAAAGCKILGKREDVESQILAELELSLIAGGLLKSSSS